MATMTSYAPGNFCWFELATNDHASAKAFYSGLFGWSAKDDEYAPGQFYTTLELGSKAVGALYSMEQAQLDRGVKPHWNLYVAVANVDESATKAKSLGGMLLMEPFDVMEHGRLAIVQDPTGAVICLWQANKHIGAQVIDELNSFCWHEVYTKDVEAEKAFYSGLFGWEVGGDANYIEWKSNGKSIGGMMEIKAEWGPVPPHWMSYVLVDDCDAYVAKAKSLGGKVMMEPDDIPGVGRYAILADPQGAAFAFFQQKGK